MTAGKWGSVPDCESDAVRVWARRHVVLAAIRRRNRRIATLWVTVGWIGTAVMLWRYIVG